jgi:pimeloyl-ACP methyl ester carboxylesterase
MLRKVLLLIPFLLVQAALGISAVGSQAMKSVAADLIASLVPSTRVELFDDAGHALFVDDATRFNAVLGDFLQHLANQ